MKSSYYDLLDKYYGGFCGDGDVVEVMGEDVGIVWNRMNDRNGLSNIRYASAVLPACLLR